MQRLKGGVGKGEETKEYGGWDEKEYVLRKIEYVVVRYIQKHRRYIRREERRPSPSLIV